MVRMERGCTSTIAKTFFGLLFVNVLDLCQHCNTDYDNVSACSYQLDKFSFFASIEERRFSAIGKHLQNEHGVERVGDLTNNFKIL